MPNSPTPKHLLVLGVGNMGGAVVRGVLDKNSFPDWTITLVDPFRESLEQFSSYPEVNLYEKLSDLPKEESIDYVLLAIKPQLATDALSELKDHLHDNSCIVSIMAGRSVHSIRKDLNSSHPIVRVMPNLPILVGKGVSLFYLESSISKEIEEVSEALFSHSSSVLKLSSEDLIDAGTAVSGSGPGFVFHLLDGAYHKAQELGFSEEEAKTLVSETVLGAIELYTSSSESLSTLENRVTSKGGTTEAGIATLKDGDSQLKIKNAIASAFERAKDL